MSEIIFESIYPDENVLYDALYSVVIWTKPKNYLEIGVNEGKSMSMVVRNTNLKRLVLCDNWGGTYGGRGRGNHSHIEPMLKKLDYKGEVRFLDGDSRILIPDFIKENQPEFDLVLVDGDHSYNTAWLDLMNAWKLVKKGGYIIMDDLIHKDHMYLNDCVDTFIKFMNAKEIYKNIERPNGVVVIQK